MNKFAICCKRLDRLQGGLVDKSAIDVAKTVLRDIYSHSPRINIPDISYIEGRTCVIDWDDNTCIHINPENIITIWDLQSCGDIDRVVQEIIDRLGVTPGSDMDILIERIVNNKLTILEDRIKGIEREINDLKRSFNGCK